LLNNGLVIASYEFTEGYQKMRTEVIYKVG